MHDKKFIAIQIGEGPWYAVLLDDGIFRFSTIPFTSPFSDYAEDQLRNAVDDATIYFEKQCHAVEIV